MIIGKHNTTPLNNGKNLILAKRITFLHQKRAMKLHGRTHKTGELPQSGQGELAVV